MRRLAQLAWVPGHLADIESDMSVFHRVDDIRAMPAARFFQLAYRLDAYRGVMRERAIAWQHEHGDEQPPRPVPGTGSPAPARQSGGTPVVTRADAADPVLGKFISFGPAGKH